MNARIPTPDVSDSSFGEFKTAQAVLDRPVDKSSAVEHYTAMAAAAMWLTTGALADCVPSRWTRADEKALRQIDGTIVGVPFMNTVFDCRCEIDNGDDHQPDRWIITEVKLNGRWFDPHPCWIGSSLLAGLQSALDAMPSNT
jgi:hypothetical protein